MTPAPDAPQLARGRARRARRDCAERAGVDPAAARAEGEALAATVAEPARGRVRRLVRPQTGPGRGAEDFTRAASRGRGVGGPPRPRLLGGLAGRAHPQAVGVRPGPRPGLHRRDRPRRPDAPGHRQRRDRDERPARRPRPAPPRALDAGRRACPPLDLEGLDDWAPGAFPGLGGDPGADRPRRARSRASWARPGPTRRRRGEARAGHGAGHRADEADEAAPAPSLEELLAELDALVGLAEVKAEIHRQVAVLRIEAKRERAGLRTPSLTRHLVFTGNPGTGKTTVARLVAGIYRALGPAVVGTARRGRPQRAGRRLPRADRAQDRRGRGVRRRRGAVRRRGLQPRRRPVRHRSRRHPRQGDGGPARRPRRRRRRATPSRWRCSSARTRAWRAGSARPSSSPTTATTSSSRSSASWPATPTTTSTTPSSTASGPSSPGPRAGRASATAGSPATSSRRRSAGTRGGCARWRNPSVEQLRGLEPDDLVVEKEEPR